MRQKERMQREIREEGEWVEEGEERAGEREKERGSSWRLRLGLSRTARRGCARVIGVGGGAQRAGGRGKGVELVEAVSGSPRATTTVGSSRSVFPLVTVSCS